MKALRQAKIREIIKNNIVETQEELAKELAKNHIKVTQATVSRDIKEMMLIKVPIGDGRYRYAYSEDKSLVFSKNRLAHLFQDSVLSVDFSDNIIVIKTLPGAANAVASTLDYANWSEVIGTVAGDDNIMVIVKPKEAVAKVMEKLDELLG